MTSVLAEVFPQRVSLQEPMAQIYGISAFVSSLSSKVLNYMFILDHKLDI